MVKQNGKWGIVNNKNQIIAPFEFEDIKEEYDPNYFILKKNGLFGIANGQGKVVIYPKYKELTGEPFHNRDYTKVILVNGKTGYIDLNGIEYFEE